MKLSTFHLIPSVIVTCLLTLLSIGCMASIDLSLSSQLCMTEEVQIIVTTDVDVESYKWSGPAIKDDSQINVIVTGAGIYTLTIFPSDNSGSQVATIEVLDLPIEDFTINSSNIITCTEKKSILTTSLIDTSLYTYSWTSVSGMELGNSPMLEARFAGVHTLQVTNAIGCTQSNSIEVIADIPAHDFTIRMDSLTCDEVGKLYITSADDIIAVNWTGPLGFNSAEQNPDISIVGFYKAKVTFSDSCQVEKNIRADYLHFAPDVEFTGEVINCDFPEIKAIFNTNPDYQYQWRSVYGIFDSQEAEPLISQKGFYEIKVMDQSGCEAIYYTNVKIDTTTAKFDIITEEINCANLSTLLDYDYNVNNFQSFEWSGPGISNFNKNIEKPEVEIEGIYTINGKTQNGCPFERITTVTKDIEPISIINGGSNVIIDCKNPEQSLIAETDRDAAQYQWFYNGNLVGQQRNINANNIGTYRAVAIGSNGCKDQRFYEVSGDINPPLITDNSLTIINCKDSIARIDINLTDANGGNNYTFEWQDENMIPTGQSALSYETTTSGIYILQSEDTENGCSRLDTIIVSEDKDIPEVQVHADSVDCVTTEALIEITSDTVGYAYNWMTSEGIIDNVSQIYSDGKEVIILRTTGLNSCISMDTISIVQDTIAPIIDIVSDSIIGCDINNLHIKTEKSGNYNYSWSTIEGLISGSPEESEITIDKEGMYHLSVIDNNNKCESMDSISILRGESMLRNVDLEEVDPRCSNDDDGQLIIYSIEGAVGPLSYALDQEQVFQSDALFEGLSAGEYIVKIKDNTGCTFDTLVELQAGHIIELEAISAMTIDEGESITIETSINQSGEEIQYNWTGIDVIDCNTCPSITFDAYVSQRVTVIGEDENGCKDKVDIEIYVNDLPDIWLANIFSPSASDAINQSLPIYIAPFVNSVESISAYDRYGNQVLALSNMIPDEIDVIWDGSYNGQMVADGVYTMLVNYTLKSGESFSKTQSITVLK